MVTEHDLLTLERPGQLTLARLGLSVEESKALLAALQNQLVPAQIERHGQCCPTGRRCGRPFRGRGSYPVTFHSLFGDVPVRVRRLRSCPCQGASRQSFSTAFTNKHPVAPELSFLTAKLAALMPFGKAAAFLAELLPLSTGANAATVRNRTRRVGQRLEQQAQPEDQALASAPPASAPAKEGVLGLDGAYVRSRHRRPEKNFEVIVGKVLSEAGAATRFAFPTNHLNGATMIRRALRRQGVGEQTQLTVFSDGEAGLRELQRKVAPDATHILDSLPRGHALRAPAQRGPGATAARAFGVALYFIVRIFTRRGENCT